MYSSSMLTQDDHQEIRKIVKEELDEKIEFLPSKAHFDKRMDELTREVQTVRDEQTLHQGQHDEITDHLERLDKHTNLPQT